VRDIRRNPAGDGTVLVQQQLDSTTVIQLFQRPAATELHSYATPAPRRLDQAVPSVRERAYAPADRLARFVGALRVEIAGPLSQDSLNRLLEQVKPLP
jgi:predicted dinucleotide-binding enzyme